jgi:Family of unknown function (DUF6491)
MKTLTAILLSAALAGVSVTTGYAAEQTKGDKLLAKYEPYLGEPVKSFTALRHDSWQQISRTQLVLYTTINDAYMLTVDNNCPELPFAQTIGVTSTTSSITTFDSVLVRNDRCRITQIQPIDVKRMKADKNARTAEEATRSKS